MIAVGKQHLRLRKRSKIRWRTIIPIYIMILPGLIYLMINNYIPLYGILIAFKKLDFIKGVFGSPWNGFENFRFLFLSADAWLITRNTIGYNIAFFIVGTISAVTMAIFINELHSKFASKFYQSATLLPFLISWVVISYLGYAFLSPTTGLINNSILKPLGIGSVNWYMESKYWPFILIFVNTWKVIGYYMIIYLSSIVGISSDYYEAAWIDGATKWQQIKHITLPLLRPTIITLLILSVGQIFRSDFGLFYQMPQRSGALYPVTRTLDVYVYQALLQNGNYGMSSAAAFYQSMVGLVLIMTANSIIKKYYSDAALF